LAWVEALFNATAVQLARHCLEREVGGLGFQVIRYDSEIVLALIRVGPGDFITNGEL